MRFVSRLVLLSSLLPIYPHIAAAADVQFDPVRVFLTARRPYGTLTMTNRGEDAATFHAQLFRWSYKGSEDVLDASGDLIINPPIVTIPAKSTQMLRLGLRTPNRGGVEVCYRVILTEVPPPEEVINGVRTILRVSIPIFAAPAQKAAPKLMWVAHAVPGKVIVSAANTGNAHARLGSLVVAPSADTTKAKSKDYPYYLLAGQTREWTFESDDLAAAEELDVRAKSDAGEMHAVVQQVR